MYLWLWGRRPNADVQESGATAAVEQLRDLLRLATR
jgi:hypothetical protein